MVELVYPAQAASAALRAGPQSPQSFPPWGILAGFADGRHPWSGAESTVAVGAAGVGGCDGRPRRVASLCWSDGSFVSTSAGLEIATLVVGSLNGATTWLAGRVASRTRTGRGASYASHRP
jgi:hypothetical protein